MHQRGIKDILVACVDGLTAFVDPIAAIYPETWVQTASCT